MNNPLFKSFVYICWQNSSWFSFIYNHKAITADRTCGKNELHLKLKFIKRYSLATEAVPFNRKHHASVVLSRNFNYRSLHLNDTT